MAFSTEGQIMSITSEVEIPTALFLKARQARRYGDVSHMWLVRRQKDADLFRRHPVLEAQRPRALGSGSATHTERSRRSQHESCEDPPLRRQSTRQLAERTPTLCRNDRPDPSRRQIDNTKIRGHPTSMGNRIRWRA